MWVPPAVVLRPLGVGERLDATFKIWARNFVAMAKAMLVIAIPVGIIEALVTLSEQSSTTTTTIGGSSFNEPGNTAAVLGGNAVILVVGVLAAALAVTTLFGIIGNSYLGQPVDWRQALRNGFRRMLSAVWISFLIGVAFVVPIFVAVFLIVLVAQAGSVAAGLGGFVLGGATLCFVVWFYTCSRLAIPVLMLEDVRGVAAIRRGFRLVRGTWWSVFGTLFLMELIVVVGAGLVGGIFGVITVAAHGDTTTLVVVNFFIRTISLVVFTPLSACLAVVLTIDMRVRKEGFDIEFMAASMGGTAGPGALSFLRPRPVYPPYAGGYPPAYGG